MPSAKKRGDRIPASPLMCSLSHFKETRLRTASASVRSSCRPGHAACAGCQQGFRLGHRMSSMKSLLPRLLPLLVLTSALACDARAAGPGAERATCPALLQHQFPRLQDDAPQDLCQYAGKVLLVVNTASYCGYTHQYEGLEALHAKYQRARAGRAGLSVQRLRPAGAGRFEADCRLLLQHLWREVPDVRQDRGRGPAAQPAVHGAVSRRPGSRRSGISTST